MNSLPYPHVAKSSNGTKSFMNVLLLFLSDKRNLIPLHAIVATAEGSGTGKFDVFLLSNEKAAAVMYSHRKSVPCSIVIMNDLA